MKLIYFFDHIDGWNALTINNTKYDNLSATSQKQREYDLRMGRCTYDHSTVCAQKHRQTQININQRTYTVVCNLPSCFRHTTQLIPHCLRSRSFLPLPDILYLLLTPRCQTHRYCRATKRWSTSLHPFLPSCISVVQCTGGHTEVPRHFFVPPRDDLFRQHDNPHY